jgi:uncharacterized repeat protein (TIGR03809 family)
MTHRPDVAGGHDVAARWCALAEQRLEYLTEMFESGRWRRFYSERAFFENIKEAKRAVETWRGLSASAPSEGLPATAMSLPPPTEPPRSHRIELKAVPPNAPPPKAAPPKAVPTPIDIADTAPTELAASDDLPPRAAVDMLALETALGLSDEPFDMSAIERRYPLLRNTL